MKKALLFFLAFQAFLFVRGQIRTHTPFELFSGIKLFYQDYNKQLQTDHIKSEEPFLQIFGIGTAHHGYEYKLNGKSGHGSGFNVYYSQVLPKIITLDSLKLRLSGYSLNFISDWDLFNKDKKFDLLLGYGLSLGRIKIKDNESAYFIKKNAFFCPLITVHPRYKIWKIFFGLRSEFCFDLSHYSWRQIKVLDKPINLNKLNQSGMGFFFTVNLDF